MPLGRYEASVALIGRNFVAWFQRGCKKHWRISANNLSCSPCSVSFDPWINYKLWQRLLGRPASESGTLRHGDGIHGRSDRCRRSFMLPILQTLSTIIPFWAQPNSASRLLKTSSCPALLREHSGTAPRQGKTDSMGVLSRVIILSVAPSVPESPRRIDRV
jgi:hypothetical protein